MDVCVVLGGSPAAPTSCPDSYRFSSDAGFCLQNPLTPVSPKYKLVFWTLTSRECGPVVVQAEGPCAKRFASQKDSFEAYKSSLKSY